MMFVTVYRHKSVLGAKRGVLRSGCRVFADGVFQGAMTNAEKQGAKLVKGSNRSNRKMDFVSYCPGSNPGPTIC